MHSLSASTRLALLATTALIGLGGLTTTATAQTADASGAHRAAESTTTHEKGLVIECGGVLDGRDVYVSLYENGSFGNGVQVGVGGEDDATQVLDGRETTDPFRVGSKVRATLRLDGEKAVVSGVAKRLGKKVAVHEEYDDAGNAIVVDGTHRRFRTTRLSLVWDGAGTRLDCGTAFAYDLDVTKTPIGDDAA